MIVKLQTEKTQDVLPLVCVEPAQIPMEGILTARGLFKTKEPPPALPRANHGDNIAHNGCAFVMVTNFISEELITPNATVLGVAEEMTG